MRLSGLICAALALLAGCGESAPDTALALSFGPGDLSPAKTLTAHALLDGRPSPETFKIVSGPLTRLGVRLPSSYQGLLHIDISAADARDCVVWRGQVERYVPATDTIALSLTAVQPPECGQ